MLGNHTISSKNTVPWTEKYRPQVLEDIVSHEEIILSLNRMIEKNSLPHLLFHGPPGTGKTTAIKCCSRKIYGEHAGFMVLELNASAERGIDVIRCTVKDFVNCNTKLFLPEEKRDVPKIVILDESDSLTPEAQGMLRQTIENNSHSTRFCLICNNIEKINPALQSRCSIYRFPQINRKNIISRLTYVCEQEKIEYTKGSLEAIANNSRGDIRSAINMLQHICLSNTGKITEKITYKIACYCPPQVYQKVYQILSSIIDDEDRFVDAINEIHLITENHNIPIYQLLEGVYQVLIKSRMDAKRKIFIIYQMSRIEVHGSVGIKIRNAVMDLCSVFLLSSQIED